MKIKLLLDVPVEKKHGMKKGRIFSVIRDDGKYGKYVVIGDSGEEIHIFKRECEELGDEE